MAHFLDKRAVVAEDAFNYVMAQPQAAAPAVAYNQRRIFPTTRLAFQVTRFPGDDRVTVPLTAPGVTGLAGGEGQLAAPRVSNYLKIAEPTGGNRTRFLIAERKPVWSRYSQDVRPEFVLPTAPRPVGSMTRVGPVYAQPE